jgi:hypothetical protein
VAKDDGCYIATGMKLVEAKNDLGHGRFGSMFEGKDALPFGIDTAEALMKIASHKVLSNPEHVPALPPHWSTLEILARIKPAQLEAWIADGRVHGGLLRHEAEALMYSLQPKQILDPEGGMSEYTVEDMALLGPSDSRSLTLTTLRRIGFGTGDFDYELTGIDRGDEGTDEPKSPVNENKARILRGQIDEALGYLEIERLLLDDLRRDPKFEEWVLRTIARLRKLLPGSSP